ncbi:MAG: DNA double-strand break repair nuclease NurA [Candidatus Bathyarchaeia archaeon]
MIEQYTIATTSKYNFPQPIMDLTLPQRFMELSLTSLKVMSKCSFQLNQQPLQQRSMEPSIQAENLSPEPIHLKLNRQPTIIAAVDTSSINLGETSRGLVIAIRGACVWKSNKKYNYLRLGPFIFHITEENKGEIYNSLLRIYIPNHRGAANPSFNQLPLRMANLLERWLQASIAKTLNGGIILFDGSLTAGTPDTPIQQLREILKSARERGNVVLAFAKMTSLRINGLIITEALVNYKPPYLVPMIDLKLKPPLTLLGDIYVAKLSTGNCAFRLDIDKEIPHDQRVDAVEKLLGNDLINCGYPETLRLAHILCTFTANEVLAMQHYVRRKHRLKIIDRPDMHKLLFGPFGKGEDDNETL